MTTIIQRRRRDPKKRRRTYGTDGWERDSLIFGNHSKGLLALKRLTDNLNNTHWEFRIVDWRTLGYAETPASLSLEEAE